MRIHLGSTSVKSLARKGRFRNRLKCQFNMIWIPLFDKPGTETKVNWKTTNLKQNSRLYFTFQNFFDMFRYFNSFSFLLFNGIFLNFSQIVSRLHWFLFLFAGKWIWATFLLLLRAEFGCFSLKAFLFLEVDEFFFVYFGHCCSCFAFALHKSFGNWRWIV